MADDQPTDDEIEHVRRLIRRERAGEQTPIVVGPHSAVVLSWVVRWAAGREPLIEWAPELFGRIEQQFGELLADDPDGEALRRRREPVTLYVGPYTAVMLLGAVDWWLRDPRRQEHGPVFLDPVTEQLVGLLTEYPTVLGMVHRLRADRLSG